MKNPTAYEYDENHAKKWHISGDFALRIPVIQKQIRTKSDKASIVARVGKCILNMNSFSDF